jgi:hypothetical protein
MESRRSPSLIRTDASSRIPSSASILPLEDHDVNGELIAPLRAASLGVAVHRETMAAVLVRAGRVESVVERARDVTVRSADDLRSLLAMVPRRRWTRYRITIAAGLDIAQVRDLEGLPKSHDLALLSRIVRESTSSFFLDPHGDLCATGLVRASDGRLTGAAFARTVVAELASALRSMGFTRVRALPTAVALSLVLEQGTHVLVDGDTAVELTVARDDAVRSRRLHRADAVAGLRVAERFDEHSTRSAASLAALGAAVAAWHSKLAWYPGEPPARIARRARIRFVASIALVFAAALSALLAPGVRAATFTRHASAELQHLERMHLDVQHAEAEVAATVARLQPIDELRAHRGMLTLLVGEIARALPESTAILTLRIDSLGGTLTVLATHATDVLPQLAELRNIASVRIVGPVTRETVAGAQLERATIRFDRPRVSSRASERRVSAAREVR